MLIKDMVLLVFEAVLQVVCISLPGYILARRGIFDARAQKLVAHLNICLFTPCLIFTRIASQLEVGRLVDLALIPCIFIAQTLVSYSCALVISKLFGFTKRPRNFLIATAVFANSNSLPISLVVSLAGTLKSLRWYQIPQDDSEQVASRGVLYIMIFQQLGQLARWSWGYHVLLAPASKAVQENECVESVAENGGYTDDLSADEMHITPSDFAYQDDDCQDEQTALFHRSDSTLVSSVACTTPNSPKRGDSLSASQTCFNGSTRYGTLPVAADAVTDNVLRRSLNAIEPRLEQAGNITLFPNPASSRGFLARICRWSGLSLLAKRHRPSALGRIQPGSQEGYKTPSKLLKNIRKSTGKATVASFKKIWAFMNPPLWAMTAAVVVASVPPLKSLLFTPNSLVYNSVTQALKQSSGVAIPLILVVLGANLGASQEEERGDDLVDAKEETRLVVASLFARMLLPLLIIGPLLAILAKFTSISVVDDPVFVVVCFLLVGAPSALQLAQICQINMVYMRAMSRILFHNYVIWILPSTLILVIAALKVVEWADE